MNFLVVIKNDTYVSQVVKILENVYKEKDDKILYVSLSRPYKSLVTNFNEDVDQNRIIVLDTITKRVVSDPETEPNCMYLSSPTAFHEILAALKLLFNKGVGQKEWLVLKY